MMISGKRRYWRAMLAIVVGGAIVFLVKYYTDVWQKSVSEVLPEVRAVSIKEEKVAVEKEYIGYVTPINAVDVYPYLNGFVSEVMVQGGQNVKVGDELVKIRPEEYIATLEEAKAAEMKAKADFVYAQNYYERIKKAGVKAVSKTEIDNAEAKFEASKGALAQAKAAVEKAEVNLGYTVITATIDGVVGNVELSVGDYITPQNKLFSIVQTDPTRVVFSISDKDYLEEINLSQMFAGEQINLRLSDGSEYEHEGDFKYADNSMDKSTNAIAVYADFTNPDRKLVDNSYVTVIVKRQYSGVVVPKDLVKLVPDGAEVNVADGNVVKPYLVSILNEYGDKYILRNNFGKNLLLVLDKVTVNKDEQKMKILKEGD